MKSLMRGFLRSTFGCVPAALSYCRNILQRSSHFQQSDFE